MNKNIIISGVIGLVLGTFIFSASSPVRFGGRMVNQIDSHFIEQMIPHHEDAITMAGIALEEAEHQEIKQLAEDIKRTQTEEIEEMRTWYKGWFGTDVPDQFTALGHGMGSGKMHMGMMGDTTDMEQLSTSATFDKDFIEQMISHHQMAVMMAQMLLRGSSRPEMIQLAENIISAQTKEIDQMREWYREWYN
ncbi:MAG: DUF305 domain-containing protein [bacterium]|nr:DUF305 domain-containing protein [bacterium]